MGDEPFDGQILTEKLSKFNSSQQSIESLSRWCTSFRNKAKQIVETWDKLFKSAQNEQRVALLYLANDILQNSRRKGSEFVNEFWKVLPAALKLLYASGHESGKRAASRVVDTWEQRKVFGSRGQFLKVEVLGKTPPLPVSNGKNPNPIKVIKRDNHSLRIKLAVGDITEKIITAFQMLHDDSTIEKGALNKCRDALSHFKKMENDIANISSQGTPQGPEMLDKIQEQETILQQYVMQLETVETSRAALISQLKEAAEYQESKLKLLRSDLKAVRMKIEQVANMKQRLGSSPLGGAVRTSEPSPPPVTSFATLKPTDEESKRAAAAAVVAKLAASTSSAQMLTSVLSSLVAEEAAASASMSSGLKRVHFSANLLHYPPASSSSPEKRLMFEKPDGGTFSHFPPPPPPPSNSTAAGMMMNYGYASAGSLSLPPLHITRQPLQPPQQQQSVSGGFYPPPGFGFYGQGPQTTPPPVPRQ